MMSNKEKQKNGTFGEGGGGIGPWPPFGFEIRFFHDLPVVLLNGSMAN